MYTTVHCVYYCVPWLLTPSPFANGLCKFIAHRGLHPEGSIHTAQTLYHISVSIPPPLNNMLAPVLPRSLGSSDAPAQLCSIPILWGHLQAFGLQTGLLATYTPARDATATAHWPTISSNLPLTHPRRVQPKTIYRFSSKWHLPLTHPCRVQQRIFGCNSLLFLCVSVRPDYCGRVHSLFREP